MSKSNKFVGKVVSNVVTTIKSEMSNKQDQMESFSADEAKEMFSSISKPSKPECRLHMRTAKLKDEYKDVPNEFNDTSEYLNYLVNTSGLEFDDLFTYSPEVITRLLLRDTNATVSNITIDSQGYVTFDNPEAVNINLFNPSLRYEYEYEMGDGTIDTDREAFYFNDDFPDINDQTDEFYYYSGKGSCITMQVKSDGTKVIVYSA